MTFVAQRGDIDVAEGLESHGSELCVKADRVEVSRASVGVVGWVPHALVIGRQEGAFPDVEAVVGLDNLLGPVVERAVTDEEGDAASLQIIASLPGERIMQVANAQRIHAPTPSPPFERETCAQ